MQTVFQRLARHFRGRGGGRGGQQGGGGRRRRVIGGILGLVHATGLVAEGRDGVSEVLGVAAAEALVEVAETVGPAAFGNGRSVGGGIDCWREEIRTPFHDSLGEESLDAALLFRFGFTRLRRFHGSLLDFAQRVCHRLQRPTENDRSLPQRNPTLQPIPSWLLLSWVPERPPQAPPIRGRGEDDIPPRLVLRHFQDLATRRHS